jgi:hypothetical protein
MSQNKADTVHRVGVSSILFPCSTLFPLCSQDLGSGSLQSTACPINVRVLEVCVQLGKPCIGKYKGAHCRRFVRSRVRICFCKLSCLCPLY